MFVLPNVVRTVFITIRLDRFAKKFKFSKCRLVFIERVGHFDSVRLFFPRKSPDER